MVDLTGPLVEQARYSLDQLRQALGWMEAMKVPGRGSVGAPRHLSDAARERQDALAREERAERYPPPRPDRTPGDDLLSRRPHDRAALATSGTPVRLGVTVAQVTVHAILLDVCAALCEQVDAVYIGPAGIRPGIVAAVGWLSGDLAARVGSPMGLDGVRDHAVAEWVAAQLDQADQMARRACGVSDQVEEPRWDRCPVCQHRALYENHTATDARHWYVYCDRLACRCSGTGCPCRRSRRVEGERHFWYGGEWMYAWNAASEPSEPAGESCSCCCHVGGAYRPACDVPGGCGSVGCDGSGRITGRAAA